MSKLFRSCLNEISLHQEIQLHLVEEIKFASEELHGNAISSRMINQLTFLESVVLEAVRKFPPIANGTRTCTKSCSISLPDGEHLKFEEGDLIHLPFNLIQNDKKFFRHPEMFNPHRFDCESSKQSLFTFGLGPRSCLGIDFVIFQTKLFIFTILSKYSVKTCDKNPKTSSQSSKAFIELVQSNFCTK